MGEAKRPPAWIAEPGGHGSSGRWWLLTRGGVGMSAPLLGLHLLALLKAPPTCSWLGARRLPTLRGCSWTPKAQLPYCVPLQGLPPSPITQGAPLGRLRKSRGVGAGLDPRGLWAARLPGNAFASSDLVASSSSRAWEAGRPGREPIEFQSGAGRAWHPLDASQ